jgi:hypothetical protein
MRLRFSSIRPADIQRAGAKFWMTYLYVVQGTLARSGDLAMVASILRKSLAACDGAAHVSVNPLFCFGSRRGACPKRESSPKFLSVACLVSRALHLDCSPRLYAP